jgi:hypothetical protein
MFIFFEASNSLFVAVETTSRSSPDTRARLHKVEAAKEGLLLGESAEYDGLHYVESFFYGWDRTRSFFRFFTVHNTTQWSYGRIIVFSLWVEW